VHGLIALAIALIAVAITAGPASAAVTRADFVTQADSICQNGQAQEAVAYQGVRTAIRRSKKHRDTVKAEKKLDRAFGRYVQQRVLIERAVNAQIATVPPAPDDVSLVQVWLRARGELLDMETRFLGGGVRPQKGLKGFSQLITTFFDLVARQYEVTDLVRDFGFQHCNQAGPEIQVIA
jgi:hypothetical protein